MILWLAAGISVFVAVLSTIGMIGLAWTALVGIVRQVLRADAALEPKAAGGPGLPR